MSKERKALDDFIKDYLFLCEKLCTNKQEKMLLDSNSPYNVLKTYLESIDNANPSEALECLRNMCNDKAISDYILYNCLDEDIFNIKQSLFKQLEQEKVLKELIKLIDDLEPTFNRKGISSDTTILGTIIKDYFYDNVSNLTLSYLLKENQQDEVQENE